MMVAPEGVAEDRRPPRRYELTQNELNPERVPVEIEGRPRPLMAWVVSNGRYRASVGGELEDARLEYQAARERLFDGPPPPDFIDSVRSMIREWENTPAEAVFDIGPHIATLKMALTVYDEVPRYKPANR